MCEKEILENMDLGDQPESVTSVIENRIDEITPDEITSIIPTEETDLSIFVEDLTSEKLDTIQAEINTLPAVTDNKTYVKTFDMHQVVKKIRQLTKKSVVAKIKQWKHDLSIRKLNLEMDHQKLLSILGPMEVELDEKRKWWDMLLDAYKMNAARDEAKAAKEEWFRIHLIGLHTSALIDNEQWNVDLQQEAEASQLEAANDTLEKERLKLEQEKFEFECDRDRVRYTAITGEIYCFKLKRLTIEEAWEEAHPVGLKKDYPELAKAVDSSIENIVLKFDESRELPPTIIKEYGPGGIANEIPPNNDDKNILLAKTEIESLVIFLKEIVITDPKKQKKLENFILNIEINFNTFKKAVT